MATVFFDLDDTLFDHSWSARASIVAVAGRWGLASPLDVLEAEYDRQLAVMHPQVMMGELSPTAARRRRFAALFALEGRQPPEPIDEVLTLAVAAYRGARRAVPGARALIDALRPRHRIGVISNNFRGEQLDKLAAIGLGDLSASLVVSEDVGVLKPDPAIFRAALAAAGASADEAVMVGDAWEADVVGARACGMQAVWFARDSAAPPIPEVPVLSSFEDVAHATAVIVGSA